MERASYHPRQQRRGIIEAGARAAARRSRRRTIRVNNDAASLKHTVRKDIVAEQSPIRVNNDAASLKHLPAVPKRTTRERAIRVNNDAASLKLQVFRTPQSYESTIRVNNDAASLKPGTRVPHNFRSLNHPRQQRRGIIEAPQPCGHTPPIASCHPRQQRRGIIEARTRSP